MVISKHFLLSILLTLGLGILPSIVFAQNLNMNDYMNDYMNEYEQKLAQYIATVNETKLILDTAESTSNIQSQKYALCQRIEAYQGILKLVEQYPEAENSQLMKMIAQNYLDKQLAGFQHSGISEKSLCIQS